MTGVARSLAGDHAGAQAAMAGLLDSRRKEVLKGCLQVRGGDAAGGVATLAQVPTMTLPHLRSWQLVGRTCLAAGHLATGNAAAAARALGPARTLVLEFGDPMLAWRVQALDGLISERRGDVLGAAGAWRQAADRYVDALAERSSRGATLDTRMVACPAGPDEVVARLPETLVRSADRDRRNKATLHGAALGYGEWARRLAAAPTGPGLLEQPVRPEADRKVHASVARVVALRSIIRDPGILAADRAFANRALSTGVAALQAAGRELRQKEASWGQYLAPAPRRPEAFVAQKGEARLYYRVVDTRTHLWLAVPGEPLRYYKLAGSDAIAAALAPARALLTNEPAAWGAPPEDERKRRRWRAKDPNAKAWGTLAKPVRAVLPFMRDKRLMKTMVDLTWRVYADGPLLGFPLEALVLSAPPRKSLGAPPVFVGTNYSLVYAMPAQTPNETAAAPKLMAVFGGLAAATGGGCPDGATCGAGVEASEVALISKAFAAEPAKFTSLGGPASTKQGLGAALAAHGVVYVAAPVDGESGAVVTSPAPGSTVYAPVGGNELAFMTNAAKGLVVSRPTAADGFPRLATALRYAGVQLLVLLTDHQPVDAELAGRLATDIAAGYTLDGALSTLRKTAMTSSVDAAAGGRATHHPYYWARWLTFSY